MFKTKTFTFNAFQENTYLLFDDSKECVIIDPGCYDKEEKNELKAFIENEHLQVKMLLNTHAHVDHVLGNYFVKETYKVDLHLHEEEKQILASVKAYAPIYGFPGYEETEADVFLKEGADVFFGQQHLKVLFVPGHSPGHIAFYHEKEKCVFSGDVLFYNSIGRTDLPGGDHGTLIESIHQQLFRLPDDIRVFPGHGPETSIGFEKKTNPYCAITHP